MKLLDLLKGNKEAVIYATLAFVFFGIICFGIGRTANIGDIGNAALKERAAELESIDAEISAQQNVLNEINDYKTQKEAKQAEISELTAQVAVLAEEVTAKQTELDRLSGAIYAIKSEKVLTTGKYVVGTDVSPGKYDVKLVSGSGNFFVNGSSYVNEIFGTSSKYYISEYKNLYLENGDEIELRSNVKIKLLLIE